MFFIQCKNFMQKYPNKKFNYLPTYLVKVQFWTDYETSIYLYIFFTFKISWYY